MRNFQDVDFGTKIGFVCSIVALVMYIGLGGCAAPPQRNRVPTLSAQVEQAQQAASDAKAAADRAEQTRKNVQAVMDSLHGVQLNSNGKLKEGHPEQTGPGVIVDFGSAQIAADENLGATTDYYLSFTFAERSGFTKYFFPVCTNQNIQTYKPIVLMFHWRGYQGSENGKRGCYQIDGQQQAQ